MMNKPTVLCSISTRGRYETTLPLAIQSVINQTIPVDKLIIFDDNDPPKDMREVTIYQYLFQILQLKDIKWEWVFAEKKGQHINHQRANLMGYEWVWRLDDDTIAEPNTLEHLLTYVDNDIGAIGGPVLTPPIPTKFPASGKISNIDNEPNLQWNLIDRVQEVDHLHCSFLYRAGIADYNLELSRIAHREETLFTYQIKQKGYRVLAVPTSPVWHMRNPVGGIRDGHKEMFDHDEQIFRNIIGLSDRTIVVLDCGMGDHVVFKHVLPLIKNPVVYSCFPEIIPGKSIAEAKTTLGDITPYNVYVWMDRYKWTQSLEKAFRKLYNV